MPETLFESKAVREFGPGSTLFSVGVHAALITAALVSVSGKARTANAVVAVHEVRWLRPTPAAHPTAPACGTTCLAVPGIPALPLRPIPLPSTVVPRIPDLGSLTRVGPIDFGSARPIPGSGSVVGTPGAAIDASQPFTADAVERVAVVATAPEPRYPDRLRDAGVSGHVLVRFVIDTTGRIEPASVAIVESSHDLFERAVRDVLPRMRFQPASVGNRRVRMLVEMPFEFRVRP